MATTNILVLANRFYNQKYQSYPLFTMACTNASFAALSDTLAQSIAILKSPMAMTSGVQTSQQFDYVRLTRYSTYGFLIAPVVYNWFNLLDKRFPFPQQIAMGKNDAQIRRETMRTVLKRMIVDQTAFAPVGLALFFGVMGLMEANGLQAVKDKFAEAYFPALKANYAVWPLVQLLNFRFLPLQYRLPFVSSIGVLWTIYLSLLNSGTTSARK